MLAMNPQESIEMTSGIFIQAVPASGQYYAFDVATGDHYKLNETAYWILANVRQGITFAELKARFAERFDVAGEVAEEDVTEFLVFAFENRLVERR